MATNMAPQAILPLPVQQVAAAYRLGAFAQVYKATVVRTIIGALLFIVGAILFLAGGIFAVDIPESTRIILLIFGLLLLGIAISMVYTVIQVGDQQIYLFQQGIVIEKRNQLQPFPWNQAAEVLQSITRRYQNGVYVGTIYIYTLRRVDGYQIKLDNLTKGIAELGPAVAQGIARELVPRAFQAIQAGQTLTFASYNVNQQGIGNEREFIPWQQVQAVDVKQGRITIQKTGTTRNWGSVMVAKMPNFLVFTVVAEEMMRQAGGVRQR